MPGAATDCTTLDESLTFLRYFKKLQDARPQEGALPTGQKSCCSVCWRCWSVQRWSPTLLCSAARGSPVVPLPPHCQRHAGLRAVPAVLHCRVGIADRKPGRRHPHRRGKTVRRSGQKRKGNAPIHTASAFAARQPAQGAALVVRRGTATEHTLCHHKSPMKALLAFPPRLFVESSGPDSGPALASLDGGAARIRGAFISIVVPRPRCSVGLACAGGR